MASVDDLFKKPYLPSNNKRKSEALKNPDEVYKATKMNGNGSQSARSNGRATVEDEPEDDEDDVAGPDMPPDLVEDLSDDEEGRFYGGGVGSDTAAAMAFLDQQDRDNAARPEKFDSAWVKKVALNFEKKISRNAELRAKFDSEPPKFMASEADLDADLKALSILSEHPRFYPEFAKLGCASSLVQLLAHENTDIAIDAIEIISELIDDDVDADETEWSSLVDVMLESDLLDLLASNLTRLNEESSSEDRSGVYQILSVFESLSSRSSLATRIGSHASLLPWLFTRAKSKENPVSQNKQYAAEVLAILLQTSSKTRTRFIELDGIDTFLQSLAAYRKRDPAKGTEEEEFAENIFDCVTCCVDEEEGKQKFLDAEGVELCLIMLKEGGMSKLRALRLLDHALGRASGDRGMQCCEKIIEAGGLKVLFTMFMKKSDKQSPEHLLGIFASMLRQLQGESAPRIRLLGKFVEKEYEKVKRLVELRKACASRLDVVDRAIQTEREESSAEEREERADEWLSRRMDAGLFSLQAIDLVLTWLIAEDDGVKAAAGAFLGEIGASLGDVKRTLQEQLDGLKDLTSEEDEEFKDMMGTLIGFL